MVGGIREENDEVQRLDKSIHRARTGDFIKVTDMRKKNSATTLGENPFIRGHDIIHIKHEPSRTPSSRDEGIWVEITADELSANGYIKAKPMGDLDSKSDQIDEYFTNSREEGIEWDGTEQQSSDQDIKHREQTFRGDDIRGDKNDLLGGHQ